MWPAHFLSSDNQKIASHIDNIPWKEKSWFVSQLKKSGLGNPCSNPINIKIFSQEKKTVTDATVNYYIKGSQPRMGVPITRNIKHTLSKWIEQTNTLCFFNSSEKYFTQKSLWFNITIKDEGEPSELNITYIISVPREWLSSLVIKFALTTII